MKAQGINNSDLKVKGPTKNKTKTKNTKRLGHPKKKMFTHVMRLKHVKLRAVVVIFSGIQGTSD